MKKITTDIINNHSISSILNSIIHHVKSEENLTETHNIQLSFANNHLESGIPVHLESGILSFLIKKSIGYFISYIDLATITQVHVPIESIYKNIILKQGPWLLNIEEAPSNLLLQRKIKEISSSYSKKIQWLNSDDPANRLILDKVIDNLNIFLQSLTSDKFGTNVLKTFTDFNIIYVPNMNLEVEKIDQTIKIQIGSLINIDTLNLDIKSKLNKIF